MKRWQIFLGVLAIVLASLACGGQSKIQTVNFANTPTFTAVAPTEVLATQTPFFVEITTTPEPPATPTEVLAKCVEANVAVHLRPSPNTSGYPIEVLANGQKVTELGGSVGKWLFVAHGDKQGWINSDYLTNCP